MLNERPNAFERTWRVCSLTLYLPFGASANVVVTEYTSPEHCGKAGMGAAQTSPDAKHRERLVNDDLTAKVTDHLLLWGRLGARLRALLLGVTKLIAEATPRRTDKTIGRCA